MPWSAQIHTGFHVSGATQEIPRANAVFEYGSVTLYGAAFPEASSNIIGPTLGSYNPAKINPDGFGLFRFRSPLLTESILFLFLRLLRCFTSPGIALSGLCIQPEVTGYYSSRVSPFGHLRIKAYLPLPEAYRSLSRPSSPGIAKGIHLLLLLI